MSVSLFLMLAAAFAFMSIGAAFSCAGMMAFVKTPHIQTVQSFGGFAFFSLGLAVLCLGLWVAVDLSKLFVWNRA